MWRLVSHFCWIFLHRLFLVFQERGPRSFSQGQRSEASHPKQQKHGMREIISQFLRRHIVWILKSPCG